MKRGARENKNSLFDVFDKIINGNGGVTQCAFQRVAIHFVMKREDDTPTIFVLHFDVTSLPMDFDKAETLKGGENLTPGDEGQFHIERARTS